MSGIVIQHAALVNAGAGAPPPPPPSTFAVYPSTGLYFTFTDAQVLGSTVAHLVNYVNLTAAITGVTVISGSMPGGLITFGWGVGPTGSIWINGAFTQLGTFNAVLGVSTSTPGETATISLQIEVTAVDQLQAQPATFYRAYPIGVPIASDPITDWTYDDISNTGPFPGVFPQAPAGFPPGLSIDLIPPAIAADNFGGIAITGTPTVAGTYTCNFDLISSTVATAEVRGIIIVT